MSVAVRYTRIVTPETDQDNLVQDPYNFQQDFMIQILLKLLTGQYAVSWENGGFRKETILEAWRRQGFHGRGEGNPLPETPDDSWKFLPAA